MRSFLRWSFSRDGWWFTCGTWSANAWVALFEGRHALVVVFALLAAVSCVVAHRSSR